MHNAHKIINDYQHYYYYCNRAGVYKSRGIGKRALQSQGTSKTFSNCSAFMKVVWCLKTDSVSVTNTHTHYNHQKQLGHLRINNDATRIVAEKFKQGIPSIRIVEDVRNTGTAEGICRKDLISEKDVNYIKKQFNIDGIQKHTNDLVSVATIVEEIQVTPMTSYWFYRHNFKETC